MKWIIFVITVVVIFFVAGKPILSFVSKIAVGTGSFLPRAAEHTGSFFNFVGSYFSSRNALTEENKLLSDEIFLLRLAVIREEALREENDQLRATLSRGPTEKRGILAEVILRPPSSPYDTLVLDVGEDAGISVGDRVMADGFSVGEITRVGRSSSVVSLWSQPGETLDISIGSTFSGRAEGNGGGTFYIRVPRDTKISEGDIVIAPALGNSLLGTVKSVVRDEKNPFLDSYAESPLHLRTIRFVEVME